VSELFLKAQSVFVAKIKAKPAICDKIYPVLSDISDLTSLDPSKMTIIKKLLNSWDLKELKFDLYKKELVKNPIISAKCGIGGKLKTPDNSNKYHKNTGTTICSETTTIGSTCHSTHAVNYYYGGLIYAACESAQGKILPYGRGLFMGYMAMKDFDATNWLKPQMQYWFDCGYSQDLTCFTSPKDVPVQSNWYDESKTSSLTKVCKPCTDAPLNKGTFTLLMEPFLKCAALKQKQKGAKDVIFCS